LASLLHLAQNEDRPLGHHLGRRLGIFHIFSLEAAGDGGSGRS
jgi:hypothetical protein